MKAKYADVQRLEQLIRRLAPLYGPSGREDVVRDHITELIKPLCTELTVDAMGNVVARCQGVGGPKARRVMISAHMDEIGLMVTHIDENGFLRFAPIGGVGPATPIGQQVMFEDGTIGSVGVEEIKSVKELDLDKLFIDIGAVDKADAEKRVRIGSSATYMRDVARAGDRLIGKALDNRVGCAAAVETMYQLQTAPSPHDVYFVFSVQEELGMRGAGPAAYAIEPDVGIAVDVTLAGDTPKGMRLNMALGAGTAIKVKDSSLITHPRVRQLLIDRATEEDIPYQMEVLPFGGTDGGAIHLTKAGVPTGVLSIPTRHLHTPAEMVDLADAAATVDLLTAVLRHDIDVAGR